MHLHPLTSSSSSSLFRSLLLTSSFDSTIKLWHVDQMKEPLLVIPTSSSSSFHYVMDVKWSPTQAAVFCAITTGGYIEIWDLGLSTTRAVDVLSLPGKGGSKHEDEGNTEEDNEREEDRNTVNCTTLNKICWSEDGMTLVVGDSLGFLYTVSVRIDVTTFSISDMRFRELVEERISRLKEKRE